MSISSPLFVFYILPQLFLSELMANSHPVKLSEIEQTYGNLSQKKLKALIKGQAPSGPIVLDRSRKPYRVIDGRHRIHLAREQKKSLISAYFQDEL